LLNPAEIVDQYENAAAYVSFLIMSGQNAMPPMAKDRLSAARV
jgi:hypothetical protein